MKEYFKSGEMEDLKSRSVCSCNNPSNCNSKCSSGIINSDEKIQDIYKN